MQKINKNLIFLLIFTIISSALTYKIVVSAYDSYTIVYYEIYPRKQFGKKIEHTDLIKVFSPEPNELIKSPLVVRGEAVGYWYFEASFPVQLVDSNGKQILETFAQAQGEWMTENFVPFESVPTFEAPATATGMLILRRDNASGDPKYDKSISIPVRFK